MLRMISLIGCLLLLTISLGVPSALAVNKVFSLDGDGDKMDVPDAVNLPLGIMARTMSVWIKLPSPQFNAGIVAYGMIGHNNKSCGMWINGEGRLAHFFWGNDLNSSTTITDNVWHHCAMTFDGTTRKLYVDGNLVASDTPSGFSTENGKVRIGHIEDNGQFLAGLIDEIQIWNIARTQAQIQETMNQPIENPELLPNLVGYWNFDGGTADDLSQYGNHGELYGGGHIADVIYVSPDGISTGDGTKENPYDTIQRGIDESGRNDIVQALPGVYEENITLYSDLIVFGSGAKNTTITASSGNIVTANNVHNVSLSGFTIDGQGSADNGIICSGTTTSEVEIRDNVITGAVKGISCSDSASPLIKYNMVRQNLDMGIYCTGSSTPVIEYNDIQNNGRFGIECDSTSEANISSNTIERNANGVGCHGSTKPNITHNTVRDNTHGIGIWSGDVSVVTISENIIRKNVQGIHIYVSASPVVRISRNIINENNGGIGCFNNANPLLGGSLVNSNSITNNGWAVNSNTANTINATYNYWGTTNENEIAAMMRNEGEGSIVFKPFINTLDEIIADVSGDGTISALDAALILQYVIGLIDKFPATSPIFQAGQKYISGEISIDELDRMLQKWGYPSVFKLLGLENQLLQNYPNPFNPETWIPFKLATDAPVTIRIYNTKGQIIRTISFGNRNAGIYTTKDRAAYWDGRCRLGEKVASGVYYYQLQAGEFSAVRKMVILK